MNNADSPVEAYWMGGRLIQIKHVSDDPAAPSFTESVLRPGQGPEMNLHHYVAYDHYLLEGSMVITVDGHLNATRAVEAGDMWHIPVGEPHTYVVGPEGARILHVTTPGHFWVNYVRALGQPATQLTLPPADFAAVPMETVRRLAKANGLQFVGGRLPGASREGGQATN